MAILQVLPLAWRPQGPKKPIMLQTCNMRRPAEQNAAQAKSIEHGTPKSYSIWPCKICASWKKVALFLEGGGSSHVPFVNKPPRLHCDVCHVLKVSLP